MMLVASFNTDSIPLNFFDFDFFESNFVFRGLCDLDYWISV